MHSENNAHVPSYYVITPESSIPKQLRISVNVVAFFREAPGPPQTGPARKMMQILLKINPGDRAQGFSKQLYTARRTWPNSHMATRTRGHRLTWPNPNKGPPEPKSKAVSKQLRVASLAGEPRGNQGTPPRGEIKWPGERDCRPDGRGGALLADALRIPCTLANPPTSKQPPPHRQAQS